MTADEWTGLVLCGCVFVVVVVELDESDDPMTSFSSLSTLAEDIACVVTLDEEAKNTANSLFPGKPVSRHIR